MKIIAKERGLGKTFDLIKRSKQTGYPIIVAHQMSKRYIVDCMKHENVYSISEYLQGATRYLHKNILIDEVEEVLSHIFLDINIDAVTFTGDIDIETRETVVKKQEVKMKP